MIKPGYLMRPCRLAEVRRLCEGHHAYGSAGNTATYCFGVYEDERLVAGYAWQPPPPGAAKSTCPEAPQGVLALSRMVAVPRADRRLNHVSKPLRRQMRVLIDRGRWPVLITYSDEGQGHTGHVYKCSGWQPTRRSRRPVYEDTQGRRASSYSDGAHLQRELVRAGWTWVQRWERWACEQGEAAAWMAAAGWSRVPTGGRWRSGAKAYTWVKKESTQQMRLAI